MVRPCQAFQVMVRSAPREMGNQGKCLGRERTPPAWGFNCTTLARGVPMASMQIEQPDCDFVCDGHQTVPMQDPRHTPGGSCIFFPAQNPLLTGPDTQREPLACYWALPLKLSPGPSIPNAEPQVCTPSEPPRGWDAPILLGVLRYPMKPLGVGYGGASARGSCVRAVASMCPCGASSPRSGGRGPSCLTLSALLSSPIPTPRGGVSAEVCGEGRS